MTTLQPLALSLLGVEPPPRRRSGGRSGEESGRGEANARPSRATRRPTSYYNSFQTSCTASTDDPPSYAIATRHKAAQTRHANSERDALPKYTCTVAAEARVLLNIESVSPLHGVAPSEWREVYLVLRGTVLSFHSKKNNGAGRLLRSYTLQHAEVGLAPDVQHVTLEPRTKLAHMIPSAARRRAWMKDPDMFEPVRQHSMRLRLETDQLVLASPCEEQIHALINAVCAGIDISCPIDERSVPRQCTVPRRRRRHRHQQPANLEDPTLLAEQERILRDMYPGFAERVDDQPNLELGRTITTITAGSANDMPNEPLATPAREEDEIDLSVIREEAEEDSGPTAQPSSTLRPPFLRSITDTSVNTTVSGDMLYATSPDNFHPDTGKWQPLHSRTPQHIQRYTKRCLPVLHAESVRASEILIQNGKRVRVNLRMEMLEEWELEPPSYKSHGFAKRAQQPQPNGMERAASQRSGSGVSATQEGESENARVSSTSMLGGEGESEDQITRVENGLANLELAKVSSLSGTTDKGVLVSREALANAKRQERDRGRDDVGEVHGVVFCF